MSIFQFVELEERISSLYSPTRSFSSILYFRFCSTFLSFSPSSYLHYSMYFHDFDVDTSLCMSVYLSVLFVHTYMYIYSLSVCMYVCKYLSVCVCILYGSSRLLSIRSGRVLGRDQTIPRDRPLFSQGLKSNLDLLLHSNNDTRTSKQKTVTFSFLHILTHTHIYIPIYMYVLYFSIYY